MSRGRVDRDVVSDYDFNPLFHGLASTKETSWHRLILERLATSDPRTNTLIDNSKRIEWAARHSRARSIDARFIHLIRDPRAMVCRWISTYDTVVKQRQQRRRLSRFRPSRALSLWRAPMEQVYLEKWLVANRRITQFLSAGRSSSNIVCYQNLTKQTAKTLGRLMPSIGLEFEPSQLNYGRSIQSGTAKGRYRELATRSEIQFDGRWRSELSRDVQAFIVGHPSLREYLKAIGVSIETEGLTAFIDP
jgi:hypothetical protein